VEALFVKEKPMHSFGENFIPVIPFEDEPLHTPTHPFCFDMACPCHDDQETISQVAQWVTDGLMSREEASDFVAGRTVEKSFAPSIVVLRGISRHGHGPCRKGNTMQHPFAHEEVPILHELDLGQHTLFIMSDGSIDLLPTMNRHPILQITA